MLDLHALRRAAENVWYFIVVAFVGAVFGIMVVAMLPLEE